MEQEESLKRVCARRYVHGLAFPRPCRVLLLLFLSLPVFLLVPAQVESQSSGLVPGQWASYNLSGDLSEGVIYSIFNVTNIQGWVLTATHVDTYQDGTREAEVFSMDLVTGQGAVQPGLYFAILPGKNVGDMVYQNPAQPLTINGRETRTYAGASRRVNHSYDVNATGYAIDYFWDLETGVFTEIASTYVSSSGLSRPGIHAVMIETSIWKPDSPQDPALLYTAAVTAASSILLAIVLIARYSRKRRGRK